MPPRMTVVAGPPGSGRSTLYPLSSFGCAYCNADDRAAELNGGSYVAIPVRVRQQVNREIEAFVMGSIRRGVSFRSTGMAAWGSRLVLIARARQGVEPRRFASRCSHAGRAPGDG